jgi:hypothetical protein
VNRNLYGHGFTGLPIAAINNETTDMKKLKLLCGQQILTITIYMKFFFLSLSLLTARGESNVWYETADSFSLVRQVSEQHANTYVNLRVDEREQW